jgi:hypothetical protein
MVWIIAVFSPIGINRWTLSHQLKELPVQQLRQFAEGCGGEEGIYPPGFVQLVLQNEFI